MFGQTLAIGHFAGRSTADLATSDWRDEGRSVHIIYGSAKGLTARGDQLWTPRSRGLPHRKLLGRELGLTMTTGRGRHGMISVLYGSARGLTATDDQLWSVSSLGRTVPEFWGHIIG